MAFHRQTVAGSLIGGVAETQEVLDFCGQHGIVPEVEMVRIDDITDDFDRVDDGKVRYRAAVDLSSLRAPDEAKAIER